MCGSPRRVNNQRPPFDTLSRHEETTQKKVIRRLLTVIETGKRENKI